MRRRARRSRRTAVVRITASTAAAPICTTATTRNASPGQHRDDHAGERGPAACMIVGPQHALDAVGRQQLLRRERRQPGRVRRVEEPVGDAQHERDDRECHTWIMPGQRRARRRRRTRGPHDLDGEQDAPLRHPVGHHAADQHGSTSPRLAPTATNDRSSAMPPSSMTCHTEATSHAPTAATPRRREQPELARRERAERPRQPGRVGHQSIVARPRGHPPASSGQRSASSSHFEAR